MKTKIQVLSIEHKSGRAKSGNDYSMDVAQCVVHEVDGKTGEEKILIGELLIPKDHASVTPGMYEAEFGLSVSQDKRIGGRLMRLTPYGNRPASSSPSPNQQKPATP